jgi:uncharacterized protein (TIGR03435 family)
MSPSSRGHGTSFLLAHSALRTVAGVFAIASTLCSSSLRAQSNVPDWQTAAGGKMQFDITSVKQDTATPSPQTVHTNIPLGPYDMYSQTGGLFSATDYPLVNYILFAYKLTFNQLESVQAQLPKWAATGRYDIQARASGNPTKDQFRLMMQALLADRFKFAMHYETKQVPVEALVLDKPGKMGPQFRQHVDEPPCSTVAPGGATSRPDAAPTVEGGYPETCGSIPGLQPSNAGRIRIGGRNVPIAMMANEFSIPDFSNADRPIIDRTGLSGKFDFVLEFSPQLNGPLPPGATFQPDPNGPSFLQALKEQLGLKLESQTGPVEVVVIDHIEQPSEN